MEIKGVRYNPSTHHFQPAEQKAPIKSIEAPIPQVSPEVLAKGKLEKLSMEGTLGKSDTKAVGEFFKGDQSQYSAFIESIRRTEY